MIWVRQRFIRVIILLIFLLNIQCVKYSFKGALPSYLETIYIPLFEDRTSWAGLREEMTTKVIDAFINDNTLSVVDNEESADLVLTATITRIQEKYVSISPEEDVEQKQIWVHVNVECINQQTKDALWSSNLSRFDDVSGTATLDEVNAAITVAVDDLVEDIVNNTIAAW